MGKLIHWELCKSLKFDHTDKWYTNKPDYVLQNKIHKIRWDFEVQIDHRIPARKPDVELINKKKKIMIEWCLPFQRNTKWKETEKRDKYSDLTSEVKSSMEHEGVRRVIGSLETIHKVLELRLEELKAKGSMEIIPTMIQLRSAKRLKRALVFWGDLLSLRLQSKTTS